MKCHYLIEQILLLVLFVAVSCTQDPYPPSLVEAERMIVYNPQKAVVFLRRMQKQIDSETKRNRMYYYLLCVKANDKAVITHDREDSLRIMQVVDYYKTGIKSPLLSEAYFYAGSVYRDLNNGPKALDCFLNAEKNLSKDASNEYKATLYGQMGSIYDYQELKNEAKQAYLKALQCDLKTTIIKNQVATLLVVSDIYLGEGKRDSCLFYLNEAYNKAKIAKLPIYMNEVLVQKANFYFTQNKNKMAFETLSLVHTDGVRPESRSNYYYIKSNLFFNNKKINEAINYARLSFKYGNVWEKRDASLLLSKIYNQQKNYREAQKQLDISVCYISLANKKTVIEASSKIDALYNIRNEEQKIIQLKTQRFYICMAFIISLVIIIFISYLFDNYRRKIKERIRDIEYRQKKLIGELVDKSKITINKNQEKIQGIDYAIKELNDESDGIIQLTAKKQTLESDNREQIDILNTRQQRLEALMNSDLLKEIVKSVAEKKDVHFLKEKDWENIESIFSFCFPNFIHEIKAHSNASTQDIQICILFKLGFSSIETSLILHKERQSITMAKKRLFKKIFKRDGTAKQLEAYLSSL